MNTRSIGRTSLPSAGADQVQIGGVGVEHPARLVGDQQAVDGLVDHGLEQRIAPWLRAASHA